MTTVRYLLDNFTDVEFSVREVKRGMFGIVRGQGRNGYGSKMPTDYMARFNGRYHRVYLMQYSNCGSLYVISKGQRFFVRDFDIPQER